MEERGVRWGGGQVGDGAPPTHEDYISLVFQSDALSSYLPLAFSPLFLCRFVNLFVYFFFFFVYESVRTV